MRAAPFRVVGGSQAYKTSGKATTRTSLRELLPLLLVAYRQNYSWLEDLSDDEVVVSSDLADVLAHFRTVLDEKQRA